MIRTILRRHLRAALREYLDSATGDPPLADVVRATVGAVEAVDRRARDAEEMAHKALKGTSTLDCSLVYGDAELQSKIDALPRYPTGWTPSPERGERLAHPAWAVAREIDGRQVYLEFCPAVLSGGVVSVSIMAQVSGRLISLPPIDAPEIASVAARYEDLAREAIRLCDAAVARSG